jgi:hypothetical protein
MNQILKGATAATGARKITIDQQPTTSTATMTTLSSEQFTMGSIRAAKRADLYPARKIESAVYAHIQAMRALGKTRINTVDIAKALGLPLAEVEKTIFALRQKGVKIANA